MTILLQMTLDKLRPDGVAVFITTKGTMDKESSKVREYLFKRAEPAGSNPTAQILHLKTQGQK